MDSAETILPLMEDFYTVQGEGVYTGYAAYFLRLGGCDVGCVWCDVKDSWDADAHEKVAVSEMATKAVQSGASMVVITGGEPAMYDLTALTQELKMHGLRVHLETSAAHQIRGEFDWITVSPKKFKFPLEEELKKAHELKIVVFNHSDFQWAEKYAPMVSASCKLLLQPEWERSEEMMPAIINYVKMHPKWSISLQTHKFMGIP